MKFFTLANGNVINKNFVLASITIKEKLNGCAVVLTDVSNRSIIDSEYSNFPNTELPCKNRIAALIKELAEFYQNETYKHIGYLTPDHVFRESAEALDADEWGKKFTEIYVKEVK